MCFLVVSSNVDLELVVSKVHAVQLGFQIFGIKNFKESYEAVVFSILSFVPSEVDI